MPFVIKIRVLFIVLIYVVLLSTSIYLIVYVSPLFTLLSILIILVGLYVLFVFYPKFDPTGSTYYKLTKGDRRIVLTFDDGPDPIITPQILDILKFYDVKAAFFCLGFKAEKYPEIINRIREEGHILANHGYSHTKLHNKSAEFVKVEIERSEQALKPLSLVNGKKLFRAPHGFKNFALLELLKKNNYVLVGWSRGIWDSDNSDASVLLERALDYLNDGVIYLLHDGRDVEGRGVNTVLFLRLFIPEIIKRGFHITNINEVFTKHRGP
ncbi:MAG: polysaccharide deacetylase family protein [Deltaproteobacteria bacterium]|nr:polysaccharide deacetylase family protein [Deltaproteobacteria bacterium]